MTDPQSRIYDGLPEEHAHWTKEMWKCPVSTQLAPISQAVYISHPVSYIYCALDNGLPYSMQKKMVADVSAKYGLSISTDVLRAGHSPYLSKTSELLEALETQLREAI
jgi:hypothetical protein